MLKLNASYSKKVPAETEYSSRSYHASIEVEIPDGLTAEQLQSRIHETFDLVRNSVETELHGGNCTTVQQRPQSQGYKPQSTEGFRKCASKQDGPASAKQISYLLDLARTAGVTPAQIAARFRVNSVEELSRNQCSLAISEFNGKAA
jgi:hypothetical protein